MVKIALFGAAGKMGVRISSALQKRAEYEVAYVESGGAGEARLVAQGLMPSSAAGGHSRRRRRDSGRAGYRHRLRFGPDRAWPQVGRDAGLPGPGSTLWGRASGQRGCHLLCHPSLPPVAGQQGPVPRGSGGLFRGRRTPGDRMRPHAGARVRLCAWRGALPRHVRAGSRPSTALPSSRWRCSSPPWRRQSP